MRNSSPQETQFDSLVVHKKHKPSRVVVSEQQSCNSCNRAATELQQLVCCSSWYNTRVRVVVPASVIDNGTITLATELQQSCNSWSVAAAVITPVSVLSCPQAWSTMERSHPLSSLIVSFNRMFGCSLMQQSFNSCCNRPAVEALLQHLLQVFHTHCPL